MTKPWTLLLLWIALWLGGSVVAAWSLQRELGSAAAGTLAEAMHDRPGELRVEARGQTLVVQGVAYREGDVAAVTSALNNVRVPGVLDLAANARPHTDVRSEVTLQPRATGWGVVAAADSAVRLRGITGSAVEGERVAYSINPGGQISSLLQNDLSADPDTVVEAEHLEGTLNSPAPLSPVEVRSAQLAFARWGEPWTVLDPEQPAEALRKRLIELGMPESAWAGQGIATEVARVRTARFDARARDAEQRTRMALPPGHVVLAVRGDSLLLRGELGTEAMARLVADAVEKAQLKRHVIDHLSVSEHRRPDTDTAPLAGKVPDIATGGLVRFIAIGTPTAGWKPVDLNAIDIEDERTLGADLLPAGLDPRLVLPDVLAAVAWIHSINEEPGMLAGVERLPHLTLIALGDQVHIRGLLAEESARSQVEAAVRQRYSARTIHAAIRLDPSCAPAADLLQTLNALPVVPAINTTGLIAITVPGSSWKTRPLRAEHTDPTGLARAGLLPQHVDLNDVLPDVTDLASAISAHIKQVNSAGPGIPLQAP